VNAERSPLRWPLVAADEMRALDQHTIDTLGIPGELLMESAGRAVAEAVLRNRAAGDTVSILCGRGNNAGDGLVAARHLHQLGAEVQVTLLGDASELSEAAASNFDRALRAGVRLTSGDWQAPRRGVVVDAIFGTGLSRPVQGRAAECIQRLNQSRSDAHGEIRVVAVDLPSGLCADSGAVLGCCVEADLTVALALPKLGLTLEPGRRLAGEISIARIGIADQTPELSPRAELWTRRAAAAALPARPALGHKGSFGHVLLVAGSEGKTGAAALAACGATRAGAGLVTIACPAGLNDILEIKCTEAMTAPVADTPQRSLAVSAVEAIVALAATRGAVGLGPGVGRSDETQKLVVALADCLEIPLVIDADGLFPFASQPERLRARTAPTILTPHPGEAAQLLGTEASTINRDRPASARRLAERTGCVVALKGAATVIAAPDGRMAINPTGGPALGSGGTGDVLLGMLVGFLVQAHDAYEATVLSVFVHGAAGDRISARSGTSGLLASELAAEVPATIAALRAEVAPPQAREGILNSLAVSFPEP
jgi:NAD(P)H-hydrate epimerase